MTIVIALAICRWLFNVSRLFQTIENFRFHRYPKLMRLVCRTTQFPSQTSRRNAFSWMSMDKMQSHLTMPQTKIDIHFLNSIFLILRTSSSHSLSFNLLLLLVLLRLLHGSFNHLFCIHEFHLLLNSYCTLLCKNRQWIWYFWPSYCIRTYGCFCAFPNNHPDWAYRLSSVPIRFSTRKNHKKSD